jgi:DNA-binding transcriptional LysR family regulator
MTAGDDRFAGRLIGPVYVLAVMPPKHRLVRKAVLDIAELADEPLLLLRRDYASRGWFDAACHAAHLKPRVILQSAAPHTVIALVRTGEGVAIVPSNVPIPHDEVRAIPLSHARAPLGRWAIIAWDRRRFLARYAEQFVEEFVAYCRRHYPGREFLKRAPKLPRSKMIEG